MYGLLMVFQNFSPRLGIAGSEWIGLANFERFSLIKRMENCAKYF